MAGYVRQSSFVDGDTVTAALFNDEYNQLVNAFHNSTGHAHDGTAASGPVIGIIGDAGETSPNNKVLIDTTNNYIEFYVEVSSNPVQQLYIADGAIIPVTDNDVDLGTSSLEFKDLYLDGTAHIDTLDVDANAGIIGNATVGGTLGVTGNTTLTANLTVNGNTTLGNAASDTVTITADVASDIIPSADSTHALGDSSNYWSHGYIDAITTTGNVAVGGNLTVTGTTTFNGGTITMGDAATDNVVFGADVDSNIIPDDDDTYDLGSSSQEWRNLYIDGTANIDSLVADTADINGGTIDSATIATSDITVGSGKTLDVSSGTFTLADNQISGDKVEGGTIAATTITTLTSTTGNITSVNATTVDTTNIELTNLKAKDGTAAGSIADSTGVVTLGSSVLTTTDINGGTIDGTTVGANSASTGAFTTLTTSGNATVGGNLTVTGTTTFNGGTITMGDAATDNVVFGADVDSNIIPDDDNTYDLGSSSQEWKDLYIDGIAYLDGINFNGTAITATAAELNILDGVTSTAAELNILDGVTSTAAELNILDGVTATAAEINALDGITSTVAELNILDGVTSTTAELNILDGVTSTATELNLLDGSTANTVVNSKAVVYGSSGELAGTLSTAAQTNITSLGTLTGLTTTGDINLGDNDKAIFGAGSDLQIYHDQPNSINYIQSFTSNELRLESNGNTTIRTNNGDNMAVFTKNGAATLYHDNNPKLATTSTGIDVTGTVTATGTSVFASLDISGDVDVDGTLETDALTIGGVTLSETIADTVGAMVTSNTESGITVAYDDSDNTLDFTVGTLNQNTTGNAATATLATTTTVTDSTANTNFPIVFHDESNGLLDDTGALRYNPSTGELLVPKLTVSGTTTQVDTVTMEASNAIIFEGATADANETTLSIVDPTSDHTQYLINQGGYIPVLAAATTTAITSTPAELNLLDGSSANTVVNSKAVIYGSSGELAGTLSTAAQANITSLGTLTALTGGTGDFNWDSNTLVVDSSTNRVGILNASPDVSLDIGSATDAVHVPVGTTGQRPTGAAGYFRYNTSLSQFEGYTDAWGAIGGGGTNTFTHDVFTANGSTTAFALSQTTESENNLIVFVDGVFQEQSAYSIATSSGTTTLTMSAAPANGRKLVVYSVAAGVSGSNLNIDTMTGDGSDTTLTLSISPVNENNTQVFFDGVYQNKSTYSISGTTLTFSTAPPTGVAVEVMTFTQTDINVPVDNTITTAKIVDDAVTSAKLDTNIAIAGTLSSGNITSSGNISLGGSDGDNAVLTLAANTGNWVFTNVQSSRNLEISDSDGTGTVFTIDTSGDVGILKTAPTSNLHIGASGADAKREIRIDGTNGSSETYGFIIQADGENGRATFKVGQGGGTPAQELMIHPDGGICFNQDTAAANALDDYEEGSFTPSFSMGSGSVSYSTQEGSYTKVGGVVNIVIGIGLSGVSSPSGNLSIVGLPFNTGNGEKFVASLVVGLARNFSTHFDNLRGYINNNASTITLGINNTNTGHTTPNANTLQSNTQLYVSMTYNTDE